MHTSININGLQSYTYHGLIEEERRLGQKFVLDLKANLRETPTHRDDELVASVRYDTLVEETLVAAFAPTMWRLERGELLLMSQNGDVWHFEADDNAQWRRVPDAADPLIMLRQ